MPVSNELCRNLVNASDAYRTSVMALEWVGIGTYHKLIEERDEALEVLNAATVAVKSELLMDEYG